MTVPALRLTAEAARRLRRAPATGRVHSAFPRALNVVLDGAGERGWLSLHGPGPIPAPFGVECGAWADGPSLAGAPVRVEADAVTVGGGLRVVLTRARVVDTALPEAVPAPPLARSLEPPETGPRVAGGLLPAVCAWLAARPAPSDPLACLAWPALVRLAAATAALDPDDCTSAVRSLLGLGPGLTPAGDDLVVGWVVGLWTSGRDGRRLAGRVRRALLAAARTRTGALSRAFLAAALDGQAAEPVCAFARCPDQTRRAALLALGATSGADLLAGYLLAHHALRHRAGRASGPAEVAPPVQARA